MVIFGQLGLKTTFSGSWSRLGLGGIFTQPRLCLGLDMFFRFVIFL